jgi:hypothetical protein
MVLDPKRPQWVESPGPEVSQALASCEWHARFKLRATRGQGGDQGLCAGPNALLVHIQVGRLDVVKVGETPEFAEPAGAA